MTTIELTLPRHWACALINGDESMFDDEEQAQFDAFVDWMISKYGKCWCACDGINDDESGDFRRSHRRRLERRRHDNDPRGNRAA